MVRLNYFLTASLAVFGANAASAVLDLLPTNFDEVVIDSKKPALVEFFAPWCGHCKKLAPIFEELGHAFEFAKDKVSVAKVDADQHKELGRRFGVQGFPTLKWFDGTGGDPEDYKGGRDFDSLAKFISDKTGIKPKVKKQAPSAVQMLTDETFSQTIGKEKNILVAFTAPWCGHCKSLAPVWETLAHDFESESHVVIAKVDAEAPNAKATAQEQGVKSYPTIKFFPKGETKPTPYEGARSEADFIKFLNTKTGTHRAVGGGLDATGGTSEVMDAIVDQIVAGSATVESVYDDAKKKAADLSDKYADYYVKVLDKIKSNKEYVEKESARLAGMLGKGGLAPEKQDDLVSRSNILRKFKEIYANTMKKDEL